MKKNNVTKVEKNTKNKYCLETSKSNHHYGQGKIIASFQNLHLGFKSKIDKSYKEVIRGVDLDVYENEILGILGESGSGKTVLTTALLGIMNDSAIFNDGKIFLGGVDVTNFSHRDWEKSKLRGSIISAVFQNPMKTLNPVRTIQDQFIETLKINNRIASKKEGIELTKEYLSFTKIKNIEKVLNLYPHELSGGMIQRVVIAMALATGAQLIIMDEPTTALDPVVQAEIINLIISIKKKFKTTFIFITHDIGVIGAVADKIAVMYAGRIVEYGKTEEIIWNPKHPYTWNLLMSMPDLNQDDTLFSIPGSVPGDATNANYEVYSPRNNYALGIDFVEKSPRYHVSDTHYVYSRLYDRLAPEFTPPLLIDKRWKKFTTKK